jgi:hypothetical protein
MNDLCNTRSVNRQDRASPEVLLRTPGSVRCGTTRLWTLAVVGIYGVAAS